MYGKLAAAGTAALVAFLWAGTADASSSGSSTFIWQIQDTGHSSLSGGKTALGMRDGQAWPVIFDEGGDIYGLFNAENGFTNTNWFQIGFDEYPSGRPNAASSPMGPVAVASDGGVQLSIAGVTGLPLDTVAVAYDAGGTLYTADPITTSFGDPGSFGGSIVDIAVADNGSRSFVTDHGEFWEYTPVTGWNSTQLSNVGGFTSFNDSVSLVYDSLSRAHVVVNDGSGVVAFDFNPQTGAWQKTFVGPAAGGATLELAANGEGGVGTAIVENSGLVYLYWNDFVGGWAGTIVQTNVDMTQQVGVAFDYDNLPVLSYRDNGNLYLAYDPVVPEPATGAVFVVLTAGLALRRRR